MAERICYGALALMIVVTIFAADVAIASALSEPHSRNALTLADPLVDLLCAGSIVPLAYLVVILRAAVEMRRLFCARSIQPFARFAYVMIALLLASPWLAAAGWLGESPAQLEGLYWQMVWLAVAIVGTAVLVVARRDPAETLRRVGATWVMILYLGFLHSFGVHMRCTVNAPGFSGAWLLLVTLLIVKVADIGGYLTGSSFGRHKLIHAVSPGKTIEGTLGGLLASGLVAVGFVWLAHKSLTPTVVPPPPATGAPLPDAAATISAWVWATAGAITGPFARAMDSSWCRPAVAAAFFGILVASAGQLGDLFESAFKRDAQKKDSGQLLPGFGGILDLMDSPALAVPVAWIFLTAVVGAL